MNESQIRRVKMLLVLVFLRFWLNIACWNLRYPSNLTFWTLNRATMQCGVLQISRTWLSMTEQRMNLCSVTGRASHPEPVCLPLGEVIISPPSLYPYWETVSRSHAPIPGSLWWGGDHEGNSKSTGENHVICTSKSPPSTAFSSTLAQPVFQALYLLTLPLAQACVWETTFAQHTAQPVSTVCSCKFVCLHPLLSIWVPPLTNWLVKKCYSPTPE